MSLIDELKRRNVFKVGAAYLALAWVVVQATGAIVPALNLPASLVPTVVWIGVIGFPCVLIFAWVYELTPEGLKRESEIDRSQSITHVTGKRLDYLIIGMLAVAIGLFVIDRVFPRDAASSAGAGHARDAGSPVGTGDARDDAADSRGSGPPPREEASTSVPDNNSIAVLPFADMSQARDQEYFSDGIAEELLNLLAKVPQLQVAARTSSFSYKGKDTRIAQIGQELNVAHVLEGSVRKAGNTLRITAQLVRTVDGYHLWSETYDRPLDDIFAVQDEIAGAVVEQLKIKLLGAAPKVRRTDPGAFTLLLQATQKFRQNTVAGFEQAFTLYQQALAIDPSYVDAWIGLGSVYSNWAFLGLGPRSADENFRLSRQAVDKALAIDPDSAAAHASLGYIAMRHDDDLAAAAKHLELALALAPGDPLAISMASYLNVALGRLGTAIELADWVTPHDPMNPLTYDAAGDANHRAGRLDEAIAHYRATLSLGAERIHANYGLGAALLLKGDKEAALTAMQAETGEGWRLTGLALAYHALGKKAESDAALAELIEKHQKSWSSSIAWVYAYRGEADAAFEWLDKAVANHDTGVMSFPTEPLLASLHDDPRWLPFLTRLGKAPEQLAVIPFEVKLPSSAAQ